MFLKSFLLKLTDNKYFCLIRGIVANMQDYNSVVSEFEL